MTKRLLRCSWIGIIRTGHGPNDKAAGTRERSNLHELNRVRGGFSGQFLFIYILHTNGTGIDLLMARVLADTVQKTSIFRKRQAKENIRFVSK